MLTNARAVFTALLVAIIAGGALADDCRRHKSLCDRGNLASNACHWCRRHCAPRTDTFGLYAFDFCTFGLTPVTPAARQFGERLRRSNDFAKETAFHTICKSPADKWIERARRLSSMISRTARGATHSALNHQLRTRAHHRIREACSSRNLHDLENQAKKASGKCRSLVGKVDDNDDGGNKEMNENIECARYCSRNPRSGSSRNYALLFCLVQGFSFQKN